MGSTSCGDHGEQILATLVATRHFILMVLNNERILNQVTWEERVQLGDGKTPLTQTMPDFPYHKYAELLGFKVAYPIATIPTGSAAAWDEALASDCPVIMNMKADPNVPPLPPHVTLKDAKNFMTMMADEPELASVIKNSAKQMLASILPGKD